MDATTPIGSLLDRQQTRRTQGVPTLSVLAGPVRLGVRAWRAWAASRNTPAARTSGSDPAGTAREWVGQVAAEELAATAVQWLAAATRRPTEPVADQLGRMTRYDLDQLWKALPVDAASPAAAAAHIVLSYQVMGHRLDPDGLIRALAPADPLLPPDCAHVIQAVCGLFPEPRWPALLVTQPSGESDPVGWFDQALRALEPVAAAVPRLPIGVAVSEAVYRAAESRSVARHLAWAREGYLAVRGVTEAELLDRLRRAGVPPPLPLDTVRRLACEGLSEEEAEGFTEAAAAVRRCAGEAGEAAARSAAERFLFEQLESVPQTAGLFRLNRPLDFAHGPRAAEADLVAERPKVVVEVDGGRYHLNPGQYRRDRRKDWLYQRHGYLVLRFLAEDVVEKLEEILGTVLEAVALRQVNPTPDTGAGP